MTLTAKITDVRTQFNLDSGAVKSFIVLELPDGVSLVSEVSMEAAQHLLKLSGHEVSEEPPPTPASSRPSAPAVEAHPPALFEQEPLQEEEEEPQENFVQAATVPQPQSGNGLPVLWELLSDEILPKAMKAALKHIGAPPMMPGPQLQVTINDIASRFTEGDWADVLGTTAAEPAPEIQTPNLPVGVVSWQEGSVTRPKQQRRARTVQADARGNPILPGFVEAPKAVDEDDLGAAQV